MTTTYVGRHRRYSTRMHEHFTTYVGRHRACNWGDPLCWGDE